MDVWILGGYQSDFARNLHREGLDFADLTAEVVRETMSAAKVRAAADQLTRGLEGLAGGRTKVRKRLSAGVDTREVYNREFGLVTPTYAVVGDWLVIGGTPQCVQGFALRHAEPADHFAGG